MSKHVAITGASSGIGEALTREMANAGYRVTMVARRRELLEKIASEIDTKTHIVEQDLSNPAEASSWFASAEEALGPIDILVNNAGIQIIDYTPKIPDDDWQKMLRLNVHTPLKLTRSILPKMMERGSGTIVDIASVAAIAPTPYMAYYNATKGALAAFSESLRAEVKASGVHVLTVYPGPIHTPMGDAGFEKYGHDVRATMMPSGKAPKLAKLIRRGVERRRARVIFPRFYWLSRWFPGITRLALDLFSPPPQSG